ncbi:MAG: R3H domain-containing nucleic acid-binding protein [Patescibacteria group bacterium]|nr:R3H domain-containing nucleic acid-binding protein [Patescibacteria group bacterium]
MNEENQKLVKEAILKLLDVMGMEAGIDEERIEDIGDGREVYTVNLRTEDPNLLIGQYGSNLQSFQHLVGIIIRKKFFSQSDGLEDKIIKFNIDVNSYKKQKKESLIKLADTIANQVIYNKNSVALRPMSAYERRVVHLEISTRKNLSTESVGEDIVRRIIIKYVEE